jgi:hypothetical protein
MEGRNTGSEGHARAVRQVIDRFEKARLKPAGEQGGWTQTLPLKEVRVEKDGTSFDVARGDGSNESLRFLHQITVRPTEQLPAAIEARLAFRGYCSAAEIGAASTPPAETPRSRRTPDRRRRRAASQSRLR